MTGPASPPAPASSYPPVPTGIRPAEFADLSAVMHLYRSQSSEVRAMHHPYPFDRPRLALVFGWMILSRRIVRLLLRIAPGAGFVLLVAEGPSRSQPLGYATIRFVRQRPEPPWARFGYLVREDLRGTGVGSVLAIALYRTALSYGVERGGGTIHRANVASIRVVEKYGFQLRPTRGGDPDQLESVQDLHEVLRHAEAALIRASGGETAPVVGYPAVG